MVQSPNFLVIRLSSIGDIVHALPAVSALGRAFPDAEIHWVVEARFAPLLDGNPFVRRVLPLDTFGWRGEMGLFEFCKSIKHGIASLRDTAYEAAIDFQGLYKSAVIARISRSKRRLGFAKPWLREPAAGIFYNQKIAPRGSHVIEMNLSLVEHMGARAPDVSKWEFPLPRNEQDDRDVEQKLARLGIDNFIVMNPGGGWKAKRWAPENFAELIRRLDTTVEAKIILTGSSMEEDLIHEILRLAAPARARYFPSTLVQFVALAGRARLFVGGDTGPMHLAAAAGTPIVAIFNASDRLNTPERNGPFRPADITVIGGGEVEVAPKNRNSSYLAGVRVDAVLAAIRKRLATAHG